jgi:hypothetical protein
MRRSFRFAHSIAAGLRNSEVTEVGRSFYCVTGRLDIGAAFVSLKIIGRLRLQEFKQRPPLVRCLETWMKTGADWHNGPPVCWVLQEQWQDVMGWRGKQHEAIFSEGRDWLFGSVTSLVSRHHYAHLHGIEEWPADWAFWAHGREGAAEYRRECQIKKTSAGQFSVRRSA